VNGLVIVDKPAGMTSHDVVARARRITGERSIGHLGTLDPMATGVLPLLLGKWTRLAQFFGRLEKAYTGTIRFGFATTTYDADGDPVGEVRAVSLDCGVIGGQSTGKRDTGAAEIVRSPVTAADVKAVAARFTGTIEQMPPAFSAKKIDGRTAYSLARAGKPVELKAVPVTIQSLEVTRIGGDTAEFLVRISAGGYVRSLAHDIGQELGCGAHLAALRRVAAGPFRIEEARTLQELESLAQAGTLEASLPHPRMLLPELPAATADEFAAGRMRNGAGANLPDFSDAELVKVFVGRHNLIGIARRVAGTLFQPLVVIG
jgi:tRNA pseudouridine55 synthase